MQLLKKNATFACGDCKSTFYCGSTCQNNDWRKQHKFNCGTKKLVGSPFGDFDTSHLGFLLENIKTLVDNAYRNAQQYQITELKNNIKQASLLWRRLPIQVQDYYRVTGGKLVELEKDLFFEDNIWIGNDLSSNNSRLHKLLRSIKVYVDTIDPQNPLQ